MKIARECLPFAVLLLALAAALGLLLHPLASMAPLPLLAFTIWFFRDPERSTPDDAVTLFSPADGKIIKAGPGVVSIFMNVFNVHVCRAPMAGRVERVEHVPGRFLAAFRDEASEQNERLVIVLSRGDRRVRFTLVAGLVARRIVGKIRPGQELAAGERIGLIRFGSRVDLELPSKGEIAVCIGQKVVAGVSPLFRAVTSETAAVETVGASAGAPARDAGRYA